MTLTTSLVHDVTSYLVAQALASPLMGAANPPVGVFDGPTPPGETLVQPQRVWIGYNAKTGGDGSADAMSRWPFLGTSGAYRSEDGEITCTAEAWSGDSKLSGVRAQCKALVGFFENLLRGYPPNGPGDSSMAGLVDWSQAEGPFDWTQSLDAEAGASAMCVFRITYHARLAPN